MIRGTTAQFKFVLPYSMSECSSIKITFWQPSNPIETLPIIRTRADCSVTDKENEICVSLTAEETLRFSDRYKAKVQIIANTIEGTTFGSRPQWITVYPMVGETTETPIIPSESEDGFIILDGKNILES